MRTCACRRNHSMTRASRTGAASGDVGLPRAVTKYNHFVKNAGPSPVIFPSLFRYRYPDTAPPSCAMSTERLSSSSTLGESGSPAGSAVPVKIRAVRKGPYPDEPWPQIIATTNAAAVLSSSSSTSIRSAAMERSSAAGKVARTSSMPSRSLSHLDQRTIG